MSADIKEAERASIYAALNMAKRAMPDRDSPELNEWAFSVGYVTTALERLLKAEGLSDKDFEPSPSDLYARLGAIEGKVFETHRVMESLRFQRRWIPLRFILYYRIHRAWLDFRDVVKDPTGKRRW